MLRLWILVSHQVALCGERSPLHSLPLEYSSCHLKYMQALDWLFVKVCFEAIDRVVLAHDLKSDLASISVHRLSMWLLQRCIDHTMSLEAVSFLECCMPCS